MEHLKMRLNQLLEKKIELDNYLAKQLPKSILQEAIQGKLVPQIAEEGTAQELLDQIKAEKQKRVKDGKLKKSALNGSVIFRGDDNYYYQNKGFARLKNVEIGYTMKDKAFMKKMHINQLRFYISGMNLLTWDHMKTNDIDVEGGKVSNFPTSQYWTVGLNLNF